MQRLPLVVPLLAALVLGGQSLIVAAPFAAPSPSDAMVANVRTTRALIQAMEQKDLRGVLSRLAEDVVLVLPLSPDGDNDPANVDRLAGWQAVRGALWRNFAAYRRIDLIDGAITPSSDGRVVFFEARGQFLTIHGRPYRNVYLIKLVFDETGAVTRIEEWTNPVTAALTWGFPLGPEPAAREAPAS